MHRKHFAVAALVVGGALTLAACGGGDDDDAMSGMNGMGSSTTATASASSDEAAAFNGADVAFATDMIQHHRQAVQMAELAENRAKSQRVKKLASQIMAAQDPEIETMSEWLTSWGKPVPEDMQGMDMSASMPGMMSQADMSSLEGMSGGDFDVMFLDMMREHHKGAIEMARREQSDGMFPDAIELAKRIETAQTQEIATIEGLLG